MLEIRSSLSKETWQEARGIVLHELIAKVGAHSGWASSKRRAFLEMILAIDDAVLALAAAEQGKD